MRIKDNTKNIKLIITDKSHDGIRLRLKSDNQEAVDSVLPIRENVYGSKWKLTRNKEKTSEIYNAREI